MFGLLASFLAGPWGLLLKIGAIAAVIGAIWLNGRSFGVNVMRPKVEAAQSEAALWQKTAQNRASLIEAQNKAIDGLKVAHDLRVTELNKRLATAILEGQNLLKKSEKRVIVLQELKLPENECEALISLVDEARK